MQRRIDELGPPPPPRPYSGGFSVRHALLTFAFSHVFNRTNDRIAEVTAGKSGIAALRAFCLEVLPLDEERVSEARIVIPFWQKAINDPEKTAIHQESMEQWQSAIVRHLAEARKTGDVSAAADDRVIAGHLLNMLLGAQITAALAAEGQPDLRLADQLESFLDLLAK